MLGETGLLDGLDKMLLLFFGESCVAGLGEAGGGLDESVAAAELGDNGRILVRPSGTEALVRVMVEGKDSAQVDTLAKRVAKTIESVV